MSWAALLWKYHKKDGVAFFLTEQGIVTDGEVIYLFLHFLLLLFFVGLLMFFLWLLFSLLLFFLAFLLLCCRPVSSKDFVINLQLIWRKILCSNPGRSVTIRTAVLLTNSYVRISVVSCIVCNVDIMGTKSWKIVIVAVRGVLIVAAYVVFEISITVVVFQWVYEGICRILIRTTRPWRDIKENTNN